ncbi:MAG TPA: putative molybdenum carrier protein [Geomonas sp.]|nr:putative molybdenum carrier protein [Geomonas sp.]
MVEKVISGGQTGVDRAALDAALDAGLPVGGCCPKGRKAEDGVIPERYPLVELDSPLYSSRTEKNVVDSDGTLILNRGALTEGTRATWDFALQHNRPCLIVQLDQLDREEPGCWQPVFCWLEKHDLRVLNVAGPRESKLPGGIYREAYRYLAGLFSALSR